MRVFWKAKTALISAAKGWACVWILILLWHMVSLLRVKSNISFTDLAGIALLWIVSTGVVTLGATVLFIIPYVCLIRADKLLGKPWRIYLESSAITTLVILGLPYQAVRIYLLAKPSSVLDVCTGCFLDKQRVLHAGVDQAEILEFPALTSTASDPRLVSLVN